MIDQVLIDRLSGAGASLTAEGVDRQDGQRGRTADRERPAMRRSATPSAAPTGETRWRDGTLLIARRAASHGQGRPLRDCFYCGTTIRGAALVCPDCADLPDLDPQACVMAFGYVPSGGKR